MKRLFITVLLCCFYAQWAHGATIIQKFTESGKIYIKELITFEDPPYVDATEISAAVGEGWVEYNSSNNDFMVSSETGTYTNDGSVQAICLTYTGQTGKHTIQFDIKNSDTSLDSTRLGTALGATPSYVSYLKYDANYFEYYNGSVWTALTDVTLAGATFHTVEMEIDTGNDTFKMWVDDTAMASGAALDVWNSEASVDRFCWRQNGSGDNVISFDNVQIYEGERQ